MALYLYVEQRSERTLLVYYCTEDGAPYIPASADDDPRRAATLSLLAPYTTTGWSSASRGAFAFFVFPDRLQPIASSQRAYRWEDQTQSVRCCHDAPNLMTACKQALDTREAHRTILLIDADAWGISGPTTLGRAALFTGHNAEPKPTADSATNTPSCTR